MPPPDTVGPSDMPTAEKEASPTPDEAPGGAVLIEEVLDQKDTPISALPPNWEEMIEMMGWVPCFTDVEPPSIKMSDFCPLTKRISMNPGGEPPFFVLARLLFGIPEFVVSHI